MSSTKAVNDYLTKKLLVEKSIVTYRLLSRELAIHVNDAKTILAEFHATAKGQGDAVFATYLISGEARPQGGDEMDIDEDEDRGDDVAETTVMLAGETELENTKGTFYRVFAVHVYSLSPSPMRDANLVCTPTPDLRKVEADKGPEFALVVGRIVGPHVKLRGKLTRPKIAITAGAASSSKNKLPGLAKAPPKPAKEEKKEAVKAESKDEKPKTKATGKLDFGKAKPKEVKREETKESVPAEKPAAKGKKAQETKADSKRGFKRKSAIQVSDSDEEPESEKPKPPSKEKKVEGTKGSESKRGLKRKSAIQVSDSDEESEVEEPKPPSKEKKAEETKKAEPKRGLKRKSTLRVSDSENEPAPVAAKAPPAKPARRTKTVIVSEDEESDAPPVRKTKGKAKASPVDSDADSRNAELKAMMDVDDEHVIKASRSASEARKEETEEDVEMEDAEELEPVPKAKPKKSTKKKVVPVGRNGLKKKRVVKSRSQMDAKGYFVTEDYSSYESVDEEEPEPAPAKSKGKKAVAAKKAAETESEAETKPKPAKEAAEPKAAGKKKNGAGAKPATGQMDLKSWFAKPKK